MRYEYRCKSCPREIRSDTRADSIPCPSCSQPAQRQWGFAYKAGFQGGYNPTLGRNISSRRELRTALSMASEKAMQPRYNVDNNGEIHEVVPPPVDYKPVDMRDKEALGVTSEGLDSTYDALRKAGKDAEAKRLKSLIDD
jgi:predicted RNA-binding Zn-ribbon protein involved in translation (DUF1610 family)